MSVDSLLAELREHANPSALAGMSRFGIRTDRALGVNMPQLRRLARRLGRDHHLAAGLWASGVHEARILASMIEDPSTVTVKQMNEWVRAFDSWDVCDQVCSNLFVDTPHATARALAWSKRPEEFVKRAGFALMACIAVSDKSARNGDFRPFFEAIEREADDDRNFVRKAVNWALRQIGKRNSVLRRQAIAVAHRVRAQGTRSARWIASDALRELESPHP